ncbi:YgiT-type zinc finger protein [Bacillus safensis]|uniref:YgiT-type zinc finger protein n=1 Tax=Bacillus safensis TaxID=561879 RepID=UPI00203B8EB3|nr:YgiT-type zinc finger protein [Bacillus safensis]MCM3367841.1 YgiT-type zinc finger protein [Bacillus safensis]
MRTIVMSKQNIEGSIQSIKSRTKVIKKALDTAKQLKSRNDEPGNTTPTKRCYCGNNAKLTHQNKYGRVKEKLIRVENVPVYSCEECNEQFISGSDSLVYAVRLKEAYAENKNTIAFK